MTPTSINMDNVKKTIGDLLRLAGCDGATDGEVRNAMRFAQRMMEEHHLTEDDLVDEPEDQEQAIRNAQTGTVSTSVGGKHSEWEHDLARFVCTFVGGIKWYYSNYTSPDRDARGIARSERHTKSVTFYGVHEDALIGGQLFDQMRLVIISLAKLKFGGCYRGEGRSYAEGFVSGMTLKLSEDRQAQRQAAQKAITASNSTALVLIDRRASLVKLKREIAVQYAKTELNLGSGRTGGGGRHHSTAYGEGRTDGRRANVSVSRQRKLT
jgi:hypothetical protein